MNTSNHEYHIVFQNKSICLSKQDNLTLAACITWQWPVTADMEVHVMSEVWPLQFCITQLSETWTRAGQLTFWWTMVDMLVLLVRVSTISAENHLVAAVWVVAPAGDRITTWTLSTVTPMVVDTAQLPETQSSPAPILRTISAPVYPTPMCWTLHLRHFTSLTAQSAPQLLSPMWRRSQLRLRQQELSPPPAASVYIGHNHILQSLDFPNICGIPSQSSDPSVRLYISNQGRLTFSRKDLLMRMLTVMLQVMWFLLSMKKWLFKVNRKVCLSFHFHARILWS